LQLQLRGLEKEPAADTSRAAPAGTVAALGMPDVILVIAWL